MKILLRYSLIGMLTLMSYSAVAQENNNNYDNDADESVLRMNDNDPLEPVNRVIFTFNEYADKYALKPAAQAYDYVVPDVGKKAIGNVLNNLNMPVVFVNSVLQADPQNAFSSLWSFILNTTLGIGGIFDFTGTNTPLSVEDEDFGQTLGVWGVGSGPYLILPLFGSSSIRDTAGFAADIVIDPFIVDNDEIVITRFAVAAIHNRYRALGLIDDIYRTSLDPYATIRSAYWQRREAQIANTHSNN